RPPGAGAPAPAPLRLSAAATKMAAGEGAAMETIDTGTDDLLAEIDEGVATITMNRPERRNALSNPMLDAMARVLARVEVDNDVGCVVLTGAGGAFCAGGDVKGM